MSLESRRNIIDTVVVLFFFFFVIENTRYPFSKFVLFCIILMNSCGERERERESAERKFNAILNAIAVL